MGVNRISIERCPVCDSADVVSYWLDEEKREAAGERLKTSTQMIRSIYPDARVCVDCDAYWFRSAGHGQRIVRVNR